MPVLVLALLAVVLTACGDGGGSGGAGGSAPRTSAAGGAASTVTRTFRVYSPTGALTVPVASTTEGNCWTTSIAVPSPGAYRCFAGNDILDPCFAAPGASAAATQVACVAAPWDQVVLLELTSQLPPTGGPAAVTRPWAFELANGARCVASTGTVPAVAGVSLEYQCAGGYGASLPDPAAARALAEYAKVGAASLRSVAVTTIWRG